MVRLMLLERLLQTLPQLRNVGGVRAIPYMQVRQAGVSCAGWRVALSRPVPEAQQLHAPLSASEVACGGAPGPGPPSLPGPFPLTLDFLLLGHPDAYDGPRWR